MPITEAQILECYQSYIRGEACPYPDGMNPNSAKMTMAWLDAIWNDRRWNRNCSSMQCSAVLARIKIDYEPERAREVALSIERDLDLRLAEYGMPCKTHRRVINAYLPDGR